MAQLGKRLSCKLEDLISISRTHVKNKKWAWWHMLCVKAETGSWPMLLGKAYVSERAYLQNQGAMPKE